MKNPRLVSIILVTIIALFFLITALLPSKYTVKREIEVNATPERVYGLVANVKEWSSWYPMYRVEPLAEYLYVGDVQQVGSHMSWRGLDIGTGEVKLTNINPPFGLQMVKTQTSPKPKVSTYNWTINELEPAKVRVTWAQEGELEFSKRWSGLFKDSHIGSTLEKGLTNLKIVSELQPLEPPAIPLDPFPNSPSSEDN
jgi:hypothetical protein